MIRTLLARVRAWSHSSAGVCAACRSPVTEDGYRADGFTFCSQACAADWQSAEVAP